MTLTHVYLVSSATLYGLCTLVWSAHPARNSSPSLRRLTLGFRSEFVPIMPRSAIIIITSTSPSLCWRLISMWLQIKPIDTVSVDVPLVVKICKHFVIKISISFASTQFLLVVRTRVWQLNHSCDWCMCVPTCFVYTSVYACWWVGMYILLSVCICVRLCAL